MKQQKIAREDERQEDTKKGFIPHYWDKALKIRWCRRGESTAHEHTPTRPSPQRGSQFRHFGTAL
jgi:hypothetical protein